MNVVRTARAQEDLIDIRIWVSAESPGAADQPLVAGEYLSLYGAQASEVEIVRVVHGRRDLGELDP